jgi:hypothetical protein
MIFFFFDAGKINCFKQNSSNFEKNLSAILIHDCLIIKVFMIFGLVRNPQVSVDVNTRKPKFLL